jgi:diguanylate cyclase (GGDEF)-like protein
VQLATVSLLAAFFVALTRTIRLQEVRIWAAAWLADAVAVAAVFVGALVAPAPLVLRLCFALYVGGKTAYVLLVVTGARSHLQPGATEPVRPLLLGAAVAAWSLLLGFLSPKPEFLRVSVALMIGILLTTGALWVLSRPRVPRSRWLGIAMLAEGLLFLYYVPLLLPILWGAKALAYTPYAPFFDAGAELFLALAILVVIERSSSDHLEHLNQELLASQERLRQLVDLDPLTSLANRRKLRPEMDRVRTSGAAVIFLDVDDFKEINDLWGHIAGDACLLRVASALGRIFRSGDSLFRLGGDEFLVVAPGLDAHGAHERVENLRAELAAAEGAAPPCRISVGIAALAPHGEPEAALREADERMYDEKRRSKGRLERDRTGVQPAALA